MNISGSIALIFLLVLTLNFTTNVYAEDTPLENSPDAPKSAEDPPVDTAPAAPESPQAAGDFVTPDYLTGPRKSSINLNLGDTFQVSLFTGAFTYYYPIKVPPGTNNLKPNLGLYYISHNKLRQSILGSSWTLSENYILRDINYTFSNTSDDIFKLMFDGQMHDLVYVPNQNRFYTKIESYLHIENKTSTNNTKGQYFIIKTKDGTAYRFGYNNDSELVSNLTNYTIKWSLDLVNDTNSNQIYYSYKEDPYPNDTSAVYLNNIQYNNDRNRTIEFLYEPSNRPDLWFVYEQGAKIQESRRLKEIIVKANNNLVNRYVINYTSNNLTVKTNIGNITVYGSDNLTSLPSTTFNYIKNIHGWTNDSKWNIPILFSSRNRDIYDYGIRFVDVNGDGLIDIVQGFRDIGSPGLYQTYINNGSGWYNGTAWRSPLLFISKADDVPDYGVRFGDVNGDGLVDLIQGFTDGLGNYLYQTYINNGTGGWNNGSAWRSPVIFASKGYGVPDYGVRLEDVNGDGFVDIIQAFGEGTGNIYETYVNNRSGGWVNSSTWRPPIIFASKTGSPTGIFDYGVRLEDVNGDGFVDIIKGLLDGGSPRNYIYEAYINNGSGGWNNGTQWRPPIIFASIGDSLSDWGVRFGDVNGDGLVDIMKGVYDKDGNNIYDVYINNGSGWVNSSTWRLPFIFMSWVGTGIPDFGVRFGDVNGDGIFDMVKSYEDLDQTKTYVVYINNISNSYLLSNITNSYGGRIDINYSKSTSFNNTGNDTISDLGFNLWVVSNITEDNGISGPASVLARTSYFYKGGYYDYKEKEFRGFAYVTEHKSNLTIKHYFHQDTSRSGLEFKKEIFDNRENPYETTQYIWDTLLNTGYYINKLTTQATYSYDGIISNPKIKNVTYSYDNFGNTIVITNLGDINKQSDERYEYFEYLNNSNLWIVDKPKHYTLYDSDNSTKLKESFFTYDNLNYGNAPIKGKLTSKEDYLDTGDNPVTNYSYDSYGNKVNETDANGNTINYVFDIRDTTHTFADRIINAKGHQTDLSYDLGTGNLLSETDSNGFIKNYTYDIFGRISKEILPYDSINYPTKEYQYEINGTAPIKIKVMQRETSGSDYTFDEYMFYDGFGRLVQKKTEAENSQQIVINTYYDENSRIQSTSNPYIASFYENYSQPDQTIKRTNYTYDPLDRIILIINPDSTRKRFIYNHWTINSYDENSNQKDYYLDTYNRITNVIEFNKEETYNTTYKYDAFDNLIQIKDSKNNTFNFTYDTLGRRIRLQDPDLGSWNYTYDKVGNLIVQIDNKNISVTFGYDQLNRVLFKNSSSENITYSYDLTLNGTLSKKQSDNNWSINYTYDNRLRKISEIKIRNARLYKANYSYNSMDKQINKILPDSNNINYTYNNQNKIKTVLDVITNIIYNQADKTLNRTYSNLLITSHSYNTDNFKLTRIKTGALQDLNYLYDNSTNIITINDTINQDNYFMTYDDLDRLTYAERYNILSQLFKFREKYTYNSIGNMLSLISDAENLTFFYNNKLAHTPTSIFSVKGDGPVSLDSGLVSYFTFDRFNSTSFIDEKGVYTAPYNTPNNVAILNSTTAYFNYSVSFNGSKTYLDILNSTDFNFSKSHTIIFWYYAVNPLISTIRILDSVASNNGHRVLQNQVLGTSHIRPQCFSNGNTCSMLPEKPLQMNNQADTWYMVTLTYNETSQTAIGYVNNLTINTDGSAQISDTTLHLRFGASQGSVFSSHKSNIDNVAIYNRTLSACEINEIYKQKTYAPNWSNITTCDASENPPIQCNSTTSTILDEGLISYFSFDRFNSTDFIDEKGKYTAPYNNSNNVAILNQTTSYFNYSVSFNGSKTYLDILNSSDFNFSKSHTMVFWYYAAEPTASSTRILDSVASNNGHRVLWNYVLGTTHIRPQCFSGGGITCNMLPESPLQMNAQRGTWYMVTLTYNETTNTSVGYVNNLTINIDGSGQIEDTNLHLRFGANQGAVSTSHKSNIDNIAIYNRTLSRCELSKIYEHKTYYANWSNLSTNEVAEGCPCSYSFN